MFTSRIICIFLVINSFLGCTSNRIIGEYASISESEWEINLYLENKNNAILKYSVWAPGEVDIETRIFNGSWRSVGKSSLVLSIQPDREILLEFVEKLEFSNEMSGPGIVFKETGSLDFLSRDLRLWKKPIDFLK